MINCAMIGLGRWGRSLVEAAHKVPRLRISRAVETDLDGARDFCAERRIALTNNFAAVLEDDSIDAVLLATPHSLHRSQVIAASAAGKQVFCEKPLALHRDDASDMFAACKAAGLVLAVGHNRRFWPSLAALREIVASGELGVILHVEGHNSNENSNAILTGWRLSPQESPGGGLTGAGLHVLDAFTSLIGPARRVYASLARRDIGPPPLDTAMLAIDFANGVTGTLSTVRATPFYWRIHVFGSEGSAEVLDEVTLVMRKSGTKAQTVTYAAIDTLAAELEAFADAVAGKRPFPVPEADVLATLAAFEAALTSIACGQPVSCDA
ncbi:MAG TPA: Gfo/Idh/MocA family oxidoreductase [Bradyrhizobium sp.]|nr:Gfo/Idh/MocA family oxidoreductase [Bradyrhizobium sp.]